MQSYKAHVAQLMNEEYQEMMRQALEEVRVLTSTPCLQKNPDPYDIQEQFRQNRPVTMIFGRDEHYSFSH